MPSELPKQAAKRVPQRAAVLVPATILTAMLLAGQTWGEGEARAGLQLAQRWCTSCHVVDAAGHGTDAAPPFSVIAAKRHDDESWLEAWLSSPHPRMPEIHLSNKEIDDIDAYLNSLVQD